MDGPGVYLVRTARQLRVLNSPARMAVVEAMTGRGAVDAGAIARATGLSTETVRYHLGRLMGIRLVREAGAERTGARPRRLYELAADRIELAPDRRGPAFRRELARGGRLMLRLAEREFERAALGAGDRTGNGAGIETEPLVSRTVGWLTDQELAEVRDAVSRLESLLRDRGGAGGEGRRGFALTVVGAPVDEA